MTDLLLELTDAGADLVLEGEDLVLDQGLATPVLVSLFGDARAGGPAAPLPPEHEDPRGWWPDTAGDRHGSLLWLLDREKSSAAVAQRARSYVEDALRWLLEEGIAARVEVEAAFLSAAVLSLSVKVHRAAARRWQALWDATAATDFSAQGLELHFLPIR